MMPVKTKGLPNTIKYSDLPPLMANISPRLVYRYEICSNFRGSTQTQKDIITIIIFPYILECFQKPLKNSKILFLFFLKKLVLLVKPIKQWSG